MSDEVDELVEAFSAPELTLAAAMDEVGEGGIVLVHATDCEIDDGRCTCTPLVIRVGAEA